MKLSDAMMLPTNIKLDPFNFCGCLLGQAVNAATGKFPLVYYSRQSVILWPWLLERYPVPEFVVPLTTSSHLKAQDIISLAAFIINGFGIGLITREQVVEWVRSVEPKEPVQDEIEEEQDAILV
jgi:hypothetical protein